MSSRNTLPAPTLGSWSTSPTKTTFVPGPTREKNCFATGLYIIKKESDRIKKVKTISISEKLTITKEEAAAYSNIGINRLDALLRAPNGPFVLFVGTKKLIKRKEFEEFISKTLVI
ncbi:MAG: hypothetical protein HFF17_12685 [Oscillospiraceae bacterium]|nr:hypothetical protein [Oscillospiraceae bacterium]